MLLTAALPTPSSSPSMSTLVIGASGFVGSLLVPSLLAEGHSVRALGRNPERTRASLEERIDTAEVEILRGDAVRGDGLDRALAGVEVAYYLIHSMESSPAGSAPFAERERLAAENFAAAAGRAGVRRIVYLGGLVPRWEPQPLAAGRASTAASRHLASRAHVERILLSAIPDSVALRASIVIGARSRSFRLLVRLVERMPVLALPAWRTFRTQPIDERDVIAMLTACATAPVGGRSLDVGGPDVVSYGEMLSRIAELMLVGRPTLRLGVSLTSLTARVVAALVAEDPQLVLALMEGLQGDLLPAAEQLPEQLGVRLHSFDSAVEHALAEWEEHEPLAAR
jgi:uncharacterized protein YbjT (DUF2867 family)